MHDHLKEKHFLHLPEYPGGQEAMKEFVAQNLRYPKEAEEAGIEGFVVVAYEVDDNGIVNKAHVEKGLGYGCDEEAVRVVNLFRFEKVKNRGRRVRVTKKTRINFHLQKRTVQVNISYQNIPDNAPEDKPKDNQGPVTYNYTIDL